jgi:hypothetical protein
MTQPFWFRELVAGGKGSDWVFNASFAPGSSSTLAEALGDHAPVGFTYYRATQRPCPIHWNSKSCDYDLYVDTPHYQACIDPHAGTSVRRAHAPPATDPLPHQASVAPGWP